MRGRTASDFDWRDAAAYAPLLGADRSLFAWEWLRRDSRYGAAAVRALSRGYDDAHGDIGPGEFGLVAFEPPHLPVPRARPMWTAEKLPFVLQASAGGSKMDADVFPLDLLRGFITLACAPGIERLLLSDGFRSIRIDARGTSLLSRPVRLQYELTGIASAKPQLLTLRRFIALASNGEFSRSLHPPDPRAERHILLLRTWDALLAGEDQRTIAAELLSDRAAATRWRVNSPSLRSQVQRLVRNARAMAAGGLWDVLL